MGKKAKTGKNRQDKFYKLAKEQGFRSRASFKLVQLNKRFDFLSTAARGVVDLCAAPGGWMQVARKHMPVGAPCIGIDLVPIPPIEACVGLVGDITTDSARADLKRALQQAHGTKSDNKVDVVLNDGSPNMGKAWLQDAYTQSELTLAALRLASDFLAPGGIFVTKVFRSNDYNSLLFVMNQLFRRVNATKPTASRTESAEIYVMCIDYRAPKAIDPRLLDPKYVFKDMASESAAQKDADDKPDLFLNTVMKDMKKQKRNRGGYADGDLTLFRRVSILDFCRTPRPIALMVESSQFSFEPRVIAEGEVSMENAERVSKILKNMPETSSEVLSCCEDLKVLARRDFKLLVKWRSSAREVLQKEDLLEARGQEDTSEGADEKSSGAGAPQDPEKNDIKDEGGSSDEEDDIDEELKKVRAEALAKEKRKKRKANKLRSAIQRKIDMKIILPEAGGAVGDDAPEGLFAIKTARQSEEHGVPMVDVPVDDPHDADDEGEGSDDDEGVQVSLPYKAGDLESTWKEDTNTIERDLDRWYKLYLSRKKRDKNGVLLIESKERKRITKRKALREAYENRQSEAGNDVQKPLLVVDSSESSSGGEDMGDDIHLPRKAGQSREAALWFSQPIFQGVAGLSSDDDSGGDSGDNFDSESRVKQQRDGNFDAMSEEEGENFHDAARKEAQRMAAEKQEKMAEDGDGFDVVPMQQGNDSDENDEDAQSESSFHSSDYDTDERAEMVAIGRRMRQSKKEAGDVLDEAYNRYTFDDPVNLPRWFADPDPVYRQRQPPVTKEQVAEMKEYIKSLQAAPTKKEAEAKARQRARAAKKLEAMKAKANSIAEQGDVPASSRMKAIEDLYKQAMKSGKSGKKNKKKVYQVVRPNGRMTVGKNTGKGRKAMRGLQTTLVDKRLKADKRGLAKARKKNSKR